MSKTILLNHSNWHFTNENPGIPTAVKQSPVHEMRLICPEERLAVGSPPPYTCLNIQKEIVIV